ncbi:MAG: uracil-DNA glycosylase [Candidatus Binatia bacterium]
MVNHSALIDLWEEIHEDRAFSHLRTSGVRLVPGVGANDPLVMVIGEAPGATENARGQPFAGKAGRVLRELMDMAGLSVMFRGNAWLTNVVKYRPPMNRCPTAREVLRSTHYLKREWRLIGKPRVLVPVGGTAMGAVAPQITGGVLRNAGRQFDNGSVFIWPMIHPAYGLRNESAIPTIEEHWEFFGEWLREVGVTSNAQEK